MRSKFTHILMLTTWLLATGSHWDLVQVYAWSRMFAHNAAVLPIRDALELTFSPDGMCRLCRAVQKGRQDNPDAPSTGVKQAVKEPLVFQQVATIVITPPTAVGQIERERPCLTQARVAPPTPPPRGQA